jgi:hypothetical protein
MHTGFTRKNPKQAITVAGASFAARNIGDPDGVFILSRWSGLGLQIDFNVNYFHQLRLYYVWKIFYLVVT